MRVAADGAVQVTTRDDMVSALRQVQATGQAMPPVDDLAVLSEEGNTIYFRREKQGKPVWYVFVFDLTELSPLLVREMVFATLPAPPRTRPAPVLGDAIRRLANR